MIRTLRLKGFRRYADETVSFGPGPNFVEGENNAGKTSILYAIEYALFGRVDGFKTMLSLVSPGARGLGVEMVFDARDGKTYRLQRAHLLPPRSRTKVVGHFTLKEVAEPERYVLSSDFQDHEEDLAQKLQELLGITRRLFQVAIHMRQGDVPRVLEGAPELDIVLGVTAAVVASEELRAQALEIEKEVAALPVLEESIRRLDEERTKVAERLASVEDDVARAQERAKELGRAVDGFAKADAARAPVVALQRTYVSAEDAVREASRAHRDQLERVGAAAGEGGRARCEAEVAASAERTRMLHEKRRELEARSTALEKERSELDLARGDLTGRIHRREPLHEGAQCESPRCEVCGAAIDRDRSARELDAWKQKLSEVDSRSKTALDALDALSQELRALASEERETAVEEAHRRARLSEIDASEEEAGRRKTTLERATDVRDANARDLRAALLELAKVTPIEFDTGDLGASLGQSLADLAATMAERRGRAEAERDGAAALAGRAESERASLGGRVAEIDRELAGLRAKTAALSDKAQKAERLRRLSEGFKELQTELRQRASVTLAADTFALHAKLSVGDDRPHEFARVIVDPAKYSVDVVPKHLEAEVPAALYEGGGHRLLLGLAFKLAIARIVGRVPFVLLDEPTYGLDTRHRATLLDRIADIGVADQILVITHETMGHVSGRRVRVSRDGSVSRVTEVVA